MEDMLNIYNDEIDELTYKLYKNEKKIRKIEDIARNRWVMIYEPILHSNINDSRIKYNSEEEYMNHCLDRKQYRDLMDKQVIINTKLSFCYKQVEKINKENNYYFY